MERIKINSLEDIYDGNKLLVKEFINLDLTGLDLSSIPIEAWEGCVFYNTSFKNTGIKFIPNKLGIVCEEKFKTLNMKRNYCNEIIHMDYCDFSDNDLSFLKREDFMIPNTKHEVIKYGCDFRNTGVNCFVNVENVLLDESYGEFDYGYWGSNIGYGTYPKHVDVNTIINNPFLNIPSARLLNAITYFVYESNYKHRYVDGGEFDEEYKEKTVSLCEEYLEYDKQDYAKKLYCEISKEFSVHDKFDFFCLELVGKTFKDVSLLDIPIDILGMFTFQKNRLENVVVNNSMSELLKIPKERALDVIKGYENKYISLYLPGITYSSWQENENAKKRISDSALTFYTKVYLELSRVCNARCRFCRNSSFDDRQYDLGKIKDTLYKIKNHINALVIGGGEPTLRLDDVRSLRDCFLDSSFDWHMFSNGSNPTVINDDYIMDNFRLNISRHAVDDYENASIFGINVDKMMSSSQLEKLNARNGQVTLNAVCFNGGLDSFEKIVDYINFARDIGCKKVLIQDLQRENSLGANGVLDDGLCIDKTIFPMVRMYLKSNGYKEKNPIYATGGYVSYVLNSRDGFSVSVQSYISKQDLDQEWQKAIKRTFDLSIDPEGNLYENWNQNTGFVKQIKRY